MKTRGFELLSNVSDTDLLPIRTTEGAAGYDLKAAKTITINPNEMIMVPTGVKAYMQNGEVVKLYDRSSNYKKLGLILINSVGIIDKDYYNNPDNEGHIMAQMKNVTDKPVTIPYGHRFVQALFETYLIADNDKASGKREGGFGSTNK